jgi:hypothetical protein
MRKDFPKIASRMGGSESGNQYGEPKRINLEREYAIEIDEHLQQVIAMSRAINDPEIRGEIIRRTQGLLEHLIANGDYIEDDDPF